MSMLIIHTALVFWLYTNCVKGQSNTVSGPDFDFIDLKKFCFHIHFDAHNRCWCFAAHQELCILFSGWLDAFNANVEANVLNNHSRTLI